MKSSMKLRHLALALTIGVLASLVGPFMYFLIEYDAISWAGELNLRLWPMKILASPVGDNSLESLIILVGYNSLLFSVITVIAWGGLKVSNQKIVPVVIYLVPVAFFEAWAAGFRLEFVDWPVFLLALIFYATAPLVWLALNSRLEKAWFRTDMSSAKTSREPR